MDRKNNDLLGLDAEINGVGEALQDHPPDWTDYRWIPQRTVLQPLDAISQCLGEHRSKPCLALLIPVPTFDRLLLRL